MSERKGTKALELWCKRLVKDCPNVQIDNMTTSWRNGIAFCALVHHFRPDLIDMSTLKPENIYDNNQLAFSIAEKHLGIPALLDPEDMVENEVPDRLSILTYLSQFYQRLGHTVNTKASENESKLTSTSAHSTVPIKFGKTGLDKCIACGLPVYLAQRLIVSHKLYHRRCFRCSKCLGHLNPKNFEFIEGSEFTCDSCKNDKTISKVLNNNDQMGMLAFSDATSTEHSIKEELISPVRKTRPQSILEKINMFEKNTEKVKISNIEEKLENLDLKEKQNAKTDELDVASVTSSNNDTQNSLREVHTDIDQLTMNKSLGFENDSSLFKSKPEKVYKSDIRQYNFLQTQLTGDCLSINESVDNIDVTSVNTCNEDCPNKDIEITNIDDKEVKTLDNMVKVENNITDDSRVANNISTSPNLDILPLETELNKCENEEKIVVPPRRKKMQPRKLSPINNLKPKEDPSDYPTNLNPFSDEEENEEENNETKKLSTNPFGSTDEENEDVPPIQPPPTQVQITSPTKRLISAYNPFWSDGEEPSSDEESHYERSSMVSSTPKSTQSRRKKTRAPPPPAITVQPPAPAPLDRAASMDDVASISSVSSYNSTAHSDQKSFGKITPRLKKRRPAPTPPDSLSTASGGGGSMDKGVDTSDTLNSVTESGGRRVKGPAPGLPLPERREVKLQMTPEELQVQLDLLETQQLGLERQGVLIEQMIRDKCEGDEASSVPQEEVEDLVIQLCELVNEKNDLFRKQTELMYIRRQQRLEQEQADIEHEIRVIQSRPAVNRIDADKAREEQLVGRLVQIVRLRDELVQQLDAERRRERQEDLAIAASIASKRAQRNSESNSSSIKSTDVAATPKKSKVKDKVKKQFKKAKHSLISKKKDDSGERKDDKGDKEKKSK